MPATSENPSESAADVADVRRAGRVVQEGRSQPHGEPGRYRRQDGDSLPVEAPALHEPIVIARPVSGIREEP